MKKGKVFTKGQIGLVAMVIILAGAVWLNTRYSKQQETAKYMGETTLVGSEQNSDAAMVGATIEDDYFSKAKADREKAYKEAEEEIEELLKSGNDENTKAAADKGAQIAKRKTDEVSAENLLKAKGFEKSLVIIGEDSISVVVKSDGLLANETVQIQDAVMSVCPVSLSNIKIVTVSG